MSIDFRSATWFHEPARHTVAADSVRIVTDAHTDLWQRTYYGFRNDNASALLLDSDRDFTFTTRVRFDYRHRFDQCGLLVYESADSWAKASIEHDEVSRLGSVVTNAGYSDWATTDIDPRSSIWYRLSRRGPDFLFEYALDGDDFHQLRIFHLHSLGETTQEMGRSAPSEAPGRAVRFGIYACSPEASSFEAVFDRFSLEPSRWTAHA